MLKHEAAAYLAGLTSEDSSNTINPTNVHVISGEVSGESEDGKVLVSIDGMMFSEDDDQYIEIDSLGGLEDGDIVTIMLTGESGHGMAPFALGTSGTVDRVKERIIETQLLLADKASIDDLEAATARIGELEADHVSVSDFQAEQASIDSLQAATADIDTIRANSAKVQNLTAAQLEADHAKVGQLDVSQIAADHATIGNLDTTYMHANMSNSDVAWIENGTIKDGAIVSAMINDVSANKLTAGTINGSVINVTNLNADNITAGTINGQRIGTGSLSLDKLSEDVYTESEVNTIVDGLNDRIDGAIETHTGTAVPTLNNQPASSWNTTALKDEHVGDVYYVVNSQSQQNGYCYRFTKSGSTYSWQLIKDSDVTAALSRLNTAEDKITSIESFDSTVSSFMTNTNSELTSVKSRATSLETRMTDAEGDISEKVDTSTFNTLSQTVDENSASITSMGTVLSNNGLTSSTNITNTVNTVSQTATGNSSKITQLTTTLGTNADGTTKTGDVVHRTSAVEQDLSGFKTTVSQTYATNTTVDGLATRVSTAESNITQNANNIALKVSESDVTGNYVVGKINLNSTTASIAASHINLQGAVTISDLASDAQNATLNSNISVGGRNLVWDTAWNDVANRWSAWHSPTTREIVEIDGKRWLHLVTTTTRYEGYEQSPSKRNGYGEIKAGDSLTVSFVAYATSAATTSCVGIHWLDGSGNINSQSWITTNLTTTPQRFTWTGKLGADSPVVGFNIMVGDNSAVARELWISEVKLEKGNTATDWSPSPEDVDSAISDAAKTATSYVTDINDNGITVHPKRSDYATSGGRAVINADGLTVYLGSDDVASYGASARIGKSNSDRVTVDSTNGITIYKGNSKRLQTTANGIDVYGSDGTTSIASFGATARIGKSNGTRVVVDTSSVKIIPNNKTANALTFEADDDYAQILYGNNYLNIGGVLFNYAYDLEAGTMWVSQGLHVGGSSTAGNPKFQVDASGLVNAGRKVVAAGNEMVALAASASSGSTNRGLWDETGGKWIIYQHTSNGIVLGNSVTDTLYKRTATCTVNTTNATIANSVNYCWNNAACCSIAIGINLKASMANTNLLEVATAPSGYRPPHTFYGSAYVTGPSVNLQTRIDEDGKIYVNNRSGSTVNTSANIYLSFTFAP